MSEAARQQALLAAIGQTLSGAVDPLAEMCLRPERVARGLAAYRANAHALAHRALAAACPTVEAMVGADQLPGLARAFWQAHPPDCGDIAEWGQALPDWLATQPALADWPWLPDAARLDLAIHHGERAEDADFDAPSLALLGEHDPAELLLHWLPGSTLVRSAYPVVALYRAHQGVAAETTADGLAAARSRLAAGQGEHALVWRRGWRCQVLALSEADAGFVQTLLAGCSLGEALAGAEPGFDFGRWLTQALSQGWLKGVARCPD